jgi:hypothetical protein
MLSAACLATGSGRAAYGFIRKIDVTVTVAAVVAMNTSKKFMSGCSNH